LVLYLTDTGVGDHHGLHLVGELMLEDGDAAVLEDTQGDLYWLFPEKDILKNIFHLSFTLHKIGKQRK
jgi:hypothetical protein